VIQYRQYNSRETRLVQKTITYQGPNSL